MQCTIPHGLQVRYKQQVLQLQQQGDSQVWVQLQGDH